MLYAPRAVGLSRFNAGKNSIVEARGELIWCRAVVERLGPYLIQEIGARQMLVGQSYPGRELDE
jgi:hypothetical protein